MTFARLLRDRRLWIGLGVLGLIGALRATGLSDHLSLATLAAHREARRFGVRRVQIVVEHGRRT